MKTLCCVATGVVLFGSGAPALAATVLPGNGAQRTFIWHSGGPGVKKIVLTPTHEAFANEPPFRLGSRPNFDPNLPQGPSNRPFYTIYVPSPNSSVLERIFASMGPDAEPGTNPDTAENDDPSPYAYVDPLAERANPFRGITPPTRNGLPNIPASGQTNRIPMSRTTDLPLGPQGDVYPTASATGDTPDSRIQDFFLNPTQGYNPGAVRPSSSPTYRRTPSAAGSTPRDSAGTSAAWFLFSRPTSFPTARPRSRSAAPSR